ncbi:unnamed protein product, partial [Sphacelaria rigidula]
GETRCTRFWTDICVDYFERFAATPALTSIKMVMAVAVQKGWPLRKFDVTQALYEQTWTEVYRGNGTLSMNRATFIDTLLKRFEVTDFSDIPASGSADLRPVTQEHSVVNRPYRSAVEGLMWLAGVARSDIANAARAPARQSHDPYERHWKGSVKVFSYLNKARNYGLTFSSGESVLPVYCD